MVASEFLILYGSATGKAESIANLIYDEAVGRGFNPRLYALGDFNKEYDLYKESTLVIVSSTTGDGDQPENASFFYRKIKRKTALPLEKLSFAILGLGDTNYSQFCKAPQNIYDRLLALKAKSFYSPGWADDGLGLDIVVEPWIAGLWNALSLEIKNNSNFNFVKKSLSIMQPDSLEKALSYDNSKVDELSLSLKGCTLDSLSNLLESTLLNGADLSIPVCPNAFLKLTLNYNVPFEKDECYQNGAKIPSCNGTIYTIPLLKSRQLTSPGALKKTLEISFDISKLKNDLKPGDAFSILCPNDPTEVLLLLNRMGISEKDADCLYNLEATAKKVPDYIPKKSSLRYIFLTCIDIRTPPKKQIIRLLCEYASNPKEKRRLQELCSKQGSDEYSSLIREHHLSILDLLLTFKSVIFPIERLIELLPRLQPRPYSIASSVESGSCDIAFNVVQFTAENGRRFPRTGVCTGWLEKLSKNDGVKIQISPRINNNFRLVDSSPIIMVGPGTGVAPFRGFIQTLNEKKNKEQNVYLFYGCRNRHLDYLYKEELEKFEETGILNRLFTSFSRENEKDEIKYVQDNLKVHKEMVVNVLLNQNGVLYVCGDAKNMSKQVNSTIISCISEVKEIPETEASKMVTELIINRQYLIDVW